MSAFSRNFCSTASRSLRQRSSVLSRAVRPIALRTPLSNSVTSRTATATAFSTMSSLKSNAPPVQNKREYDPEIKDIASYIHNTKIDSELAVWSIKLYLRMLANFTLI
jgi:2-methylcitrate dehydratase